MELQECNWCSYKGPERPHALLLPREETRRSQQTAPRTQACGTRILDSQPLDCGYKLPRYGIVIAA